MTPEQIARLRRSAAMASTMPTTVVHELLDEVERLQALLHRGAASSPSAPGRGGLTNDQIMADIEAAIERLGDGRLAEQLLAEGQSIVFLDGDDIVRKDPDGTREVVGHLNSASGEPLSDDD